MLRLKYYVSVKNVVVNGCRYQDTFQKEKVVLIVMVEEPKL